MFLKNKRRLSISALLCCLLLLFSFTEFSLLAQNVDSEPTSAIEQPQDHDESSSLNSSVKISKEIDFIKINQDPFLSLIESLLLLTGSFLLLVLLWYLRKPQSLIPMERGLQVLNLSEKNQFIPLNPESQSLEFLTEIETQQKLRLSANLNRVILTPHQNTFLLEDKNYKNALLINRRRSHRSVLWDNDVLDVGEMVLLYRNPEAPAGKTERLTGENPPYPITGEKPKGPIRKGTPILVFNGSRQEVPLVRNISTIGTSSTNDVILEKEEVAKRHARIVKVGEQWKLQNLRTQEVTLVNGRRIEQRFLNDGDEITIGNTVFKFKLSKGQPSKQVKKTKEEPQEKVESTQ